MLVGPVPCRLHTSISSHRAHAPECLSPASPGADGDRRTPRRGGRGVTATRDTRAGRVLIVEDGVGSYILAAVRSLGAAGWTVGLGGPRRSRAGSSRWVSHTHVVPPAEAGLDAFVGAVAAAVEQQKYDVVFGGDDVEVLALSAARDRISASVPYAPHDAVVRSIDKLELTAAARAAGLAVPATVDATPEAVAATDLPVFVKARLHWTPGAVGDSGRLAAARCDRRAEVEQAVVNIETAGGRAVLQSSVDGDLGAVTALCGPGGRILAHSQQVATRLSPRWRTSTRAETVPPDPDLLAGVAALLADLGWFGVANLQFLSAPPGPPRLIDLNGRFYGSLALAVAAGLDLPAQWAALARGADVEQQPPARIGVRYQALEEDLLRARRDRQGGLLEDLTDTARYAPGASHTTWDRSDRRPAAARLATLAHGSVARRLRRTGG